MPGENKRLDSLHVGLPRHEDGARGVVLVREGDGSLRPVGAVKGPENRKVLSPRQKAYMEKKGIRRAE